MSPTQTTETLNLMYPNTTVDTFTAIELTDPDREFDADDSLLEELKETVLDSSQYQFGHRVGVDKQDTLRVHDRHHDEVFDLAPEGADIIIYPRTNPTSASMRDIVQHIWAYYPSYSIEKVGDRD